MPGRAADRLQHVRMPGDHRCRAGPSAIWASRALIGILGELPLDPPVERCDDDVGLAVGGRDRARNLVRESPRGAGVIADGAEVLRLDDGETDERDAQAEPLDHLRTVGRRGRRSRPDRHEPGLPDVAQRVEQRVGAEVPGVVVREIHDVQPAGGAQRRKRAHAAAEREGLGLRRPRGLTAHSRLPNAMSAGAASGRR